MVAWRSGSRMKVIYLRLLMAAYRARGAVLSGDGVSGPFHWRRENAIFPDESVPPVHFNLRA